MYKYTNRRIAGDAIGIGVKGSGNVIGKNIHIGGGNYIFTQYISTTDELQNNYRVDPNRLIHIRNNELREIKEWINKWYELKGKGIERVLLITGQPGIGKSWLAYRIFEDFIKSDYYTVAMITRRQLLAPPTQKENQRISNDNQKIVLALDDRGTTIDIAIVAYFLKRTPNPVSNVGVVNNIMTILVFCHASN